MTLNANALAVAADAVEAAITHLQLHNGAPGADYTANVVGTRVAATGSVAGNSAITKTGAWTGLTANQPITHVSYWSLASGGVNYGGSPVTGGDTAANSSGQYNITITEPGSAT